jgi:3-oxoacyl-[acyl-carrier-protein] synthase II
METFINGLSCISHHNTVSDDFFFEGVSSIPSSNFLFITPPEYKDHIPTAAMRRMSHVLKMGIGAGLICLGKENKPDAIIVGTAMGCYEDSDKFLRSMDENDERMLNPTPFIQSTHNTVAGQLALLIKSNGYNFTYVHQNLSFEYALIDSMMLLKEAEAKTVLVGGVDELNPALCELFERAGHIKKTEDLNVPLWNSNSKGHVAGEGAAFFNLSSEKNSLSEVKVSGVRTIQKIDNENTLNLEYDLFLKELGLEKENVSLLLSGTCGDKEKDRHLIQFQSQTRSPIAGFKHLCGEYFTSSAFALWLAAKMLQKQSVPDCVMIEGNKPGNLQHIIIANHYEDKQYSFICVSKC